jgi:glycosyltransferase involved in cell wall biosynthesis
MEPAVMSGLHVDDSWLCRGNRLKRGLFRTQFPRDAACGYPVYRGWHEDGVKEVAAAFRPDIVIVQNPKPGPLLKKFADCSIPGVAYVHEVESIDDLGEVASRGVPFLANSRFTAGRLDERFGIEAEVIYPLVKPEEYRTESSRSRVLFVNAIPRKGLETAFRLAEDRPDIPFDFIYPWNLKSSPRIELFKRAGRAGNVEVHASTVNMKKFYGQARILMAPSYWEETWGRVATEAHISGIPVIASAQGGLPESVGPGGIVVPIGTEQGVWLRALSELWDNHEKYSQYARSASNYSMRAEIQPDVIVEKLVRRLINYIGLKDLGSHGPVVEPTQK